MRLLGRLLAGLAMACTASGTALATPRDCRFAPDIVAAADFLLVDPKNEQRFWRDHVSTDAAYLMIRYGGLSQAGATRLVESLRQRRVAPQRIQDLRLALAPPDARIAMLEDMQEGSSVPPGGPSFFRAMILDGRADWLFADMARRAAHPNADRAAVRFFQVRLAASLADIGDAERAAIAAKAESHGLWTFVLELLAGGGDPEAWLAALRRSPLAPADQEALTQAFTPVWRGYATLRPRRFLPDMLPPDLRLAVEALDARAAPGGRAFEQVMDLVRLAPSTHMLLTLVNQTGDSRLGSEVAAAVLAEVRAGRIDPQRDADRIAVLMAQGIVSVLGLHTARVQLQSFRTSGGPPPSETALSALERAVARSVLAGHIGGRDPTEPARPDFLAFGFDWSGWLNTAGLIRSGQPVPNSYRAVAAELLHASGRHQDAVDVLRVIGPSDEARRLGHAMLVSLDQICGGELWPPAALSDPVYRFEPRR